MPTTIGQQVGAFAAAPVAQTISNNKSGNSFSNILDSILSNAAPIIGAINGNTQPGPTVIYSNGGASSNPYTNGSIPINTTPPEIPKKNNTGLIIGIVAAVVVLAVVLFFVFKK